MKVYIEEMVAEAERELGMRRRVYQRRVEAGVMSQADAGWKMGVQEEIIGVLKVLAVGSTPYVLRRPKQGDLELG